MKTLNEEFPSYPTIEDLIPVGNPEGQFFADTAVGYFTCLDFLFEFDLDNNLARIITIDKQRDGKYGIQALESRPLRDSGDFVYWVRDYRLVLARDLPPELQPLAKELISRYNTERIAEK